MHRSISLAALFALVACSSSSNPPAGGAPADSGAASDSAAAADANGSGDAANAGDASDAAAGSSCSAARAQLLGAVDTVSTGAVSVLGTSGGVMTLFIDASAGGINGASTNPWTFVSLATGAKAQVTDVSSTSSTAWDLAIKRDVLYTNDGDGGPGQGGAVLVAKDFASVTSADATSATFATETFFDAQCNPFTDPVGSVLTTFSTWYTYDQQSHVLTPAAGTWLVKGATGTLYKLAILSYYAEADGGVPDVDGGPPAGDGGGTYVVQVGAL